MRKVNLLLSSALTLIIVSMLAMTPKTANAQSVLDRIKKAAEDAAKKGQQQQKQPQQQPQPAPAPAPAPGGTTAPARGNPAPQPNAQPAAAAPANIPASSAKVDAQVVAAGVADPNSFVIRPHYFISPHGVHLAMIVQRGSRWVVSYDGVDGPRFDQIVATPFTVYTMTGEMSTRAGSDEIAFSPDGTRYFYIARLGQEFVVMVDGKEMLRTPVETTAIAPTMLSPAGFNLQTIGMLRQGGGFTPDSKHVFFTLHTMKGTSKGQTYNQLVWDGQVSSIQTTNLEVALNADGEHYAYVAYNPMNENQSIIVLDGKTAGYTGSKLMFTASGQHLFATAPPVAGRTGEEILVDGKPWVRAEGIRVFMPMQGERVVSVITAGTGTPNRTQFLHVDGKKVPGTDCTNIGEVHFSPDGKRYAADCETPARSHAVLFDTKRGQEYQQIAYYGFSPDSSKVIYVGSTNLKDFLVVDDKETDGYNNLGQVTERGKTSPVTYGNGGKRLGFVTGADDGGQVCYVWVDNKVTQMKLPGCASNFSFSPDASRYAFVSGTNFRSVYVDGAPLPGSVTMDGFNYNNHLSGRVMRVPYVWSPDSKHVVYWGSSEDKPGMFVDGKMTTLPLPNAFFPTFSADGRHFIFGAPGPMQGSPTAYLFIYVDGRIAARFSGGAGRLIGDDYAWEMGADGTFTFLVQDETDIKRVRITPGDDTSIDTMLAQSRTVK